MLWQRSSSIIMAPEFICPCFTDCPILVTLYNNITFIFQSSLPYWTFYWVKAGTQWKRPMLWNIPMHFPFLEIKFFVVTFHFFLILLEKAISRSQGLRMHYWTLNFKLNSRIHRKADFQKRVKAFLETTKAEFTSAKNQSWDDRPWSQKKEQIK